MSSMRATPWLPVFDSSLAVALKNRINSRLYLRPALPNAGLQPSDQAVSDIGDETEEKEFANRLDATNRNGVDVQRSLHAKMILVDGKAGSVLYAGSSNCTRRGLGLGGPSNFEAGFVYRLTPRQRKRVSDLLSFAGPATEVVSGSLPSTVQPTCEEKMPVPRFLSEVVASGTVVTIHFRKAIPSDLVLLMPIPQKPDETEYWLIYRADPHSELSAEEVSVDLSVCLICDHHLNPLSPNSSDRPILPHVFVEARWDGHSTAFPVRFDDKTRLPLILMGRKPTEAELIEYFLSGKEPEDWDEVNEVNGLTGSPPYGSTTDAPIDTSQILAYFIRRFVQAIPRMEVEIQHAAPKNWPNAPSRASRKDQS
jgi:hypothetical protein